MIMLSISRECSNLLKLASALLVMFSHYFNIKASSGEVLNPIEWLIRSQGGNIGVAIFFFLSGYGLMMSEIKTHLSFRQYFRRRFLKVYLPVLLVTAIWLPIAYNIAGSSQSTEIEKTVAVCMGGGKRFVIWL